MQRNNKFLSILDSESAAKEENGIDSLQKLGDIQERENKGKKEKKLKSKGAEKGVESPGVVAITQETQVLPERKGGPSQKLLIRPGGLWYDLVSTDSKLIIKRSNNILLH